MQGHRQRDGVDEDHVVPKRESEKRFAGRQCVHGVEHLNNDENRKRDG